MSLGIYFNAPTCEHCKRGGDAVWSRSPTYNLREMWTSAGLPFDEEIGGKRVAELLPKLEAGLAELLRDPTKYRAMNPPNGWGTYEGLVEVVESAIEAAKQYPDAIVSTWR